MATTKPTQARLGLGASDGTTEGSSAVTENNAVAVTPVVRAIDKTGKVFMKVNLNGVVIAEADLTSLDENGFTLNRTTNDAVATQLLYLALGSASPPTAPPLLVYSENGSYVQNYMYWRRYATDRWSGWGPAPKDPNVGVSTWAQQHKVVETSPASGRQAIVWKNHNGGASVDDLMAVTWDGTNWDNGSGS